MLPFWFKKGEGMHETNIAFNIVSLAQEGDASVLKKTTRSGTSLFKPHEDDSLKGLLIHISSTGAISAAEEITLDEFKRLE